MKDFLWEILYCFLYGPIYIFGFLQGFISSSIERFVNGFKLGVERGRELIESGKSGKETVKILLEEAKHLND